MKFIDGYYAKDLNGVVTVPTFYPAHFQNRGITMEDINKIRIYDAGGVVFDRYTIIFVNRKSNKPYYEALAASRDPYHPQGFGQHILCLLPNKYNRVHLGRRLRLDQLPEKVQDFVKDNYQ